MVDLTKVSFLAMPFMLAAIHGFAETTRLVAVFSGTVTSGENLAWVGGLTVTFLINVLARTGWIRLCMYLLLKRVTWMQTAVRHVAPLEEPLLNYRHPTWMTWFFQLI